MFVHLAPASGIVWESYETLQRWTLAGGHGTLEAGLLLQLFHLPVFTVTM